MEELFNCIWQLTANPGISGQFLALHISFIDIPSMANRSYCKNFFIFNNIDNYPIIADP